MADEVCVMQTECAQGSINRIEQPFERVVGILLGDIAISLARFIERIDMKMLGETVQIQAPAVQGIKRTVLAATQQNERLAPTILIISQPLTINIDKSQFLLIKPVDDRQG